MYTNPYAPIYLRNIFPNIATDKPSLSIWKRGAITGAAAAWTTGEKATVDPSWVKSTVAVGWIAGVLLIVFMVISLIVLLKFMRFKHPLYLKAIMLLTFVGFYIFFMTEPTLSGGQRVYFVLYTFFVGLLVGLNKRITLKENNYLN